MTSIVIYTNEKILLHKRGVLPDDPNRSKFGYYHWGFSRQPKYIEKGDRVYFAISGKIVGSFRICHVLYGGDTIEWSAMSWRVLAEPIPCKPFRGFRYMWW